MTNYNRIFFILVLISFWSTQACAKGISMTQKNENTQNLSTATFAGGCFWCMAGPFEVQEGVKKVISGYAGGTTENPTYEEVSSGTTGHLEVIQVFYDSTKVNYEKLLEIFWRQIDPTDAHGQFVDKGSQYLSAIFYKDEDQKKLAEKSKEDLGKSGRYTKPIVTKIVPLTKFYPAEDYHQDYHTKNPWRYQMYRQNSGRDQFLDNVWKR